jgi:hypothetical protein
MIQEPIHLQVLTDNMESKCISQRRVLETGII